MRKIYYALLKWIRSLAIKNKTVTVVSNNCWGGFMYQSCKLQYHTPFIGLFMVAPDYIKLHENFDDIIHRPLLFKRRKDSKYSDYLVKDFIIGVFEGTDIEIVFKHYHSEEEVREKWYRRLQRLDAKNMIVKFSDSDLCTEDLIRRFDVLPFKNKICFTGKPYPKYKSVKYMSEFKESGHVVNEWAYSYNYYNFVREANKIQ